MRVIESEVWFYNASQSALGRMVSLGFLANSGGVSNSPMRILGNYAFVYLLAGSGIYEDENGVFREVCGGDLILLSPDVAHAYGPRDGEKWDEMHAVFDGPIFDLWRQSGLWAEMAPVITLQPLDFWSKRFEAVFELARADKRHRGSDTTLQQICALQHIFADALAQTRATQKIGSHDAQWLSDAREKLASSTRFRDDAALEVVAREMGASYENFRKKFAALGGVSPGKYRLAQKMDRACEMLYETDLPHKKIADELGFCDEYHFSRQFKRTVGCSPQQFRKRLPQMLFAKSAPPKF